MEWRINVFVNGQKKVRLGWLWRGENVERGLARKDFAVNG
jgi:hypothetical protein